MCVPGSALVHDTSRRGMVTNAGGGDTDAVKATPPSSIHKRGQQVHHSGGPAQKPTQQDAVHAQ
jgi:hypothetical protein